MAKKIEKANKMIAEIELKVKEVKDDMDKFGKGNDSAARRARARLMDIKNLCTPIRDAIQDARV